MDLRVSALDGIEGPDDLRALDPADLVVLAREIRTRLINDVSRNGGHLGPNLGVVELTIALHRVFQSPQDRLLFDTGHQAYVHKMLTGRTNRFDTLRQSGGLSGYPCRAESPHDVIENSHASTALGYADGLARGYAIRGEQRRVVAVVGDGALTGGMAWEALNNIGAARRSVIVVLNDNGRSYGPTVGGVAEHLARLRIGDVDGANLFGNLGLHYLGPVDGHDVGKVETALRTATGRTGPTIIHCVTRKGAGHAPAEQDDIDRFHTVPAPRPAGVATARPPAPTWTAVFGEALAGLADARLDLVALTAAMLHPVGLAPFVRRHPERVIDVGIAEQHAAACAAGLSLAGLHPVVAIYATFLNRAFDQILMDVALHRCGVTFVADRAGVTGDDGPSHNGVWDMSLFGVVPGMRIAAPRDGATLGALLREAVEVRDGPTVLRFPKGAIGPELEAVDRYGRADLLRGATGRDADVLLIGVGPTAGACLAAANLLSCEGISTTVVDPRWPVPVDPMLLDIAAGHRVIVTVEDNSRRGGVGTLVAQAVQDAGLHTPVRSVGVAARFLAHGSRSEVLAAAGITPQGVARMAQSTLECGKAALR